MGLSPYLETALLNHAFGGKPYDAPFGIYLGLFTSDPDSGGVEVSGGGYSRQLFSGIVTGNTFSAEEDIDFPAADGRWGPITHVGVFDAASGGNLLASGELVTPRFIGDGDIFREASLTVTLE